MADNKKYYYLKLKEGFFDTEDMKLLQAMKDGYMYSDILLKLYLQSLRQEGRLMYRGIVPYTPDMIATVTHHQVGTVEKAMDIFEQLGIIEILDNGAIYMLDIQNFIGQSSDEADRKRSYRREIEAEKARLLDDGMRTNVQTNVQTNVRTFVLGDGAGGASWNARFLEKAKTKQMQHCNPRRNKKNCQAKQRNFENRLFRKGICLLP